MLIFAGWMITSMRRPARWAVTFLRRQQILLDACSAGTARTDVSADEQMLVDLVRHDVKRTAACSPTCAT